MQFGPCDSVTIWFMTLVVESATARIAGSAETHSAIFTCDSLRVRPIHSVSCHVISASHVTSGCHLIGHCLKKVIIVSQFPESQGNHKENIKYV